MRPPRKKGPWSQPLADFVVPAMSPVLAKNGFGEADILLNWEEIAGERLAAVCEPIKIQWPGRAPKASPDAAREPAVLVLRVEGAFALEAQHLAPVIIERVNGHLGWKCIGRIALRQGPPEPRKPRRVQPPMRDLAAEQAAAALVGSIEDAGLRAALTRLGGRVLAGSREKV